jgi:carbamoyl-phosphate synthase large subunit
LIRALLDSDEATRAAAIEVAGSGGIAHFAGVLLSRTREEPSQAVRDRIVDVVVKNQWEPASSREIVELRLWAQRQLDAAKHPTSRGSLDAGNPQRIRPFADSTEHSVTVLVTGAGGPAGTSVIRALRRAGHFVVAVDADPLAVGLRLADQAAVVPRGDDERFVDVLLEIANATGATALLPTVAEELGALSREADRLSGGGLAHWIPDPYAVEVCIDKWKFARAVRKAGIAAPSTGLGSANGVPGPWVVKPRFGRGSRDVHLIDNRDELSFVLARVPQPIVQTRLEGREFTVDALVGRDGKLAGAVPRWRLEIRGGISTKGETFSDRRLTKDVATLLAAVGLEGPANIQGFVGENGSPSFVEVNPRFSGGLPLSLMAGSDLVGEYLRGILGGVPRRERLRFRPGVRMTRHFEEVFDY